MLANGSLSDWWTPASNDEFLKRAQCVVDTYDNYYVSPDLHVNGALTEGENLADMGGVRISYMAYKEYVAKNGEKYDSSIFDEYFNGFSEDQLYFISYAQVWCQCDRCRHYMLFLSFVSHQALISVCLTLLVDYYASYRVYPRYFA